MIPTTDEIDNFREILKQDGIEMTKKKLCQKVYGAKDNWKCQEAENYVKEQEDAFKNKIKQESLEQAKQSNMLQDQANKIALWALGISILAFVISVVAIFK